MAPVGAMPARLTPVLFSRPVLAGLLLRADELIESRNLATQKIWTADGCKGSKGDSSPAAACLLSPNADMAVG